MSYDASTTSATVPATSLPADPAVPATGSASNPLALIALIGAFFVPLIGIICGHIALAQIKRDGRPGKGMALAAVILGYAFTAIWVIVMALSLMITFAAAS